jgi:endonuclease/exonuclease/phosphatase family metal-dependent hydrolase
MNEPTPAEARKVLVMRRNAWVLVVLLVFLLLVIFQNAVRPPRLPRHEQTVRPGADFLFCFWNVENFFDDRDDGRKTPGDKEYDGWLANHPDLLARKLDKLSDLLTKLNDGQGPDILACVEVESERAAELLRDALNARLPAELHYRNIAFKEVTGLRHIAPAVITRLPVVSGRTRQIDKRLRILETHLDVDGHELVLVASHWSSRLRESGEAGRESYADKIYGRAQAIVVDNPAADVLICGDFNDTPDDVSVVKHLHAIGDIAKVRASTRPLYLLDLFADRDAADYGTHYHSPPGWLIFDHIVASPGLLDNRGWTCDVESARRVNRVDDVTLYRPQDRQKRPWRYGSPREKGARGYSDHFPVTVRLRVERAGQEAADVVKNP